MTAEHWSAPSLEQALELLSGDLPREYQSWKEVPTSLLPTPMSRDWKGSGPADGNRHDPNLSAIPRLLLTPRAFEGGGNGPVEAERHSPGLQAVDYHLQNWGQYADAIAQWEALTRPAPPPTETGPKGNPRLSPAFSEWLMGLPAGWITDVPGVTRNEALKLAGNGVCPQQCEAALRFLLGVGAVAA